VRSLVTWDCILYFVILHLFLGYRGLSLACFRLLHDDDDDELKIGMQRGNGVARLVY